MTLSDLADVLARNLGADLAARAAAVLIEHAPGETLYIPQRLAPPRVLPSDTVASLRARYACSRRTAYNWINRQRASSAAREEAPPP